MGMRFDRCATTNRRYASPPGAGLNPNAPAAVAGRGVHMAVVKSPSAQEHLRRLDSRSIATRTVDGRSQLG